MTTCFFFCLTRRKKIFALIWVLFWANWFVRHGGFTGGSCKRVIWRVFTLSDMCMSCDLDVKESWATLNERHGATWNTGCLRLERSCGGDSWINMCVQADLLSFFTSGITESSSHRETQDLSLDPSIVSISKGHFIKFFSVINTLISLVVWYMKNVMDSSRRWEHWTDLTFPNAASVLFSSVHRLLLHPDMFETVLPLYGLSLCLLFIVKKISWLWCNVKPWSASPSAEL